MARPPRIEYEGAVYHVTARGNERRDIFRDDEDRKIFLLTMEEGVCLYGFKVFGYCLMPNHYHLLLETPRANLSQGMGWFQSTYSIRFNSRHRRSGHLFQGRFKAHLVDADQYAMELLRYVHLNPVRPKDKTSRVPPERWQQLQRYPWSSHRFYNNAEPAPKWLDTSWLSYFGSGEKSARNEYRRFIQWAFEGEIRAPWDQIEGGVVFGGEQFRERVEKQVTGKVLAQITTDAKQRRESVRRLAEKEAVPWQAWLRVFHGGEKRIEVARSLGYKDGSAITHILKRLETRCKENPLEARYAALLIEKLENLSSFKV